MKTQWWRKLRTAVNTGLTIALVCFWEPTNADAIPVLDQFYICQAPESCGGVGFGTQFAAQTFTAGITGSLSEVNIDLYVFNGPGPVEFEIRDVVAGVPGSTVLASTTLTSSAFSLSNPVTFPQIIPLQAGTSYSIVVHSDTYNLNWNNVGLANGYASGALLLSPTGTSGWFGYGGTPGPADGTFRTFMEPLAAPIPEPATFLLLGSGLAGLAAGGWRKRRKAMAKSREDAASND